MLKPPIEFCIDSFEYVAYLGEDDRYGEPVFDTPITINNCRIDRGAEYTATTAGKQLLYNAVIFCYADITTPLPKFTTQSIIKYDDADHVVTKVIPIYEPFKSAIYAYELEVV